MPLLLNLFSIEKHGEKEMPTKKEKTAMSLFKFGYVDSIISARAELSINRVKEIRSMYNLFKEKQQ